MHKSISTLMAAAAWGLSAGQAAAQSDPQLTADVSLAGGISSNPFLLDDPKTTGSVTLGISPTLLVADELGETRISGDLRLTQYLQRYGTDVSGALAASTIRNLDARTTARVSASAHTARSATRDGLIFVSTPGDGTGPLLPPDLPAIDTTLAGTRSRVTTIAAGVSVSHLLDERSSLNAGIDLAGTYIEEGGGFDYRSATAQLGYERKVSVRTTVTFGAQFGAVDYLGRGTGDSKIVSPRIGVQHQLSDRLSLSADAGISYVRTDVGPGHSDRVSFAGSIGLCDRSTNRSLCFSAARSAQPTALGGVSTVTTASLNYDARLSRVDRLSVGARYGRTNQDGVGLPFVRVTDFVGASATYSRDISDRIAFTVTPSYTKIFDDQQPRRANYALMAGLTLKLGKRR